MDPKDHILLIFRAQNIQFLVFFNPTYCPGMDASVTPIPDQPGTSLVQTTDFFYPLVDDPYLQVTLGN